MNKAVMLSMQPKRCELIASGKKTIEVRKTAPKLQTPFKVYVYATKPKTYSHPARIYNSFIMPKSGECGSGRVIGEFVCDKIDPIGCHKYHNGVGFDYMYYTDSLDTFTNETQLSNYDLQRYFGQSEDGETVGYAWHISDLKIYDTPKELGEFTSIKIIRGYHKKNEPKITGLNKESIEVLSHSKRVEISKLTRPPQSWCYIEEM